MTYADFAAYIGAQEGDQVTFIGVRPSISAGVDEPFGVEMLVARVILSPANGEFAETAFLSPVAETQGFGVNDANPLNEGNIIFGFESPQGLGKILWTGFARGTTGIEIMAGCAILSRKNPSGSWLRSKSALGYDHLFNENGYTLRQASMVVSPDILTPSDWYLNNANTGEE